VLVCLFQIEIEAILSLNPDLIPKGHTNQNVIPTKLTRVSKVLQFICSKDFVAGGRGAFFEICLLPDRLLTLASPCKRLLGSQPSRVLFVGLDGV
jgi:hypothetical protein